MWPSPFHSQPALVSIYAAALYSDANYPQLHCRPSRREGVVLGSGPTSPEAILCIPREIQRIAKGAGKKVPRENCRKVSKNFLTLFDDF